MNEFADAAGVELSILQQAYQNKVPVNGSIELSPLCNLDCDMCYVRLSPKELEKKGHLRSVDEWLAVSKELHDAGVLFLLLTGGEPLLYPDFKKLYLELKQMGMILTINTNGTLLDEEWADFFAQHKPRRINITLYGANNASYETLCHTPDGFDRTIRAIRLLKERNVDVKVGCSAVSKNIQEVSEIQQICKDLDVPLQVDTYMYPSVREREKDFSFSSRLAPMDAAKLWYSTMKEKMPDSEYQDYRLQLLAQIQDRKEKKTITEQGFFCMATNCSFSINWQGLLRPCVMSTTPSFSVFENGFMAAWKSLQKEANTMHLCQECQQCELRPVCRICVASALAETGKTDQKSEYICQLAKYSYELLMHD